jgi:outer membrane receptor protein involved in Fe transport
MKKQTILFLFVLFTGPLAYAQSVVIRGKVTNENFVPLSKASVKIKDGKEGAITDSAGNFRLSVASLPVTLEFSEAESDSKEMTIAAAGDVQVVVVLQQRTKELGEIVIGVQGDNRISGKLINSPVSIEVINRKDFINSPGAPYDIPVMKKGVDVTISSMTYRTYSTRGFNGSGSSRVNQLMDGMDNQAPGLNFSVGNFIGLTDLDMESIEILPGASSALYGPGGVNGTILINSKNPFKYPGFSLQVKNGLTDIGQHQRNKTSVLYDYSLRWAKNFNDKFAFKFGAQYLQANDWLANDSSNYNRDGTTGKIIPGTRQTDPNYDGVNVYGDETSLNMQDISNLVIASGTQQFVANYRNLTGMDPSQAQINGFLSTNPNTAPFYLGMQAGIIPNQNVSRTGYHEIDVIDPKTKNLKLNGALHYKINKNLEAIVAGHWATGNTVYTGNNRYALKDIKVGQYKIELKHKNWFLRGYTTQEDAGEAYSATVTSQYFNEAWKPSGSWYPQYIAYYVGAVSGGASSATAHQMARGFADQGRPAAGSDQFKHIFDSVRSVPIPKGGLFVEHSQLWMGEGQYSFAEKIKFADVIVGANVKQYVLSSDGTLFIDKIDSAIKIMEWGAYAQITKKLLDDKLVLSASGRYDKNENFDGKFTPRFTTLIKAAEGHHFRLSYQTAYKFPTTQQQWINLNVGTATLLGGLPWILNTLQPEKYPTYDYNNGQLVPWTYKKLKPETMRSFEIGYKSVINKKFLVDAYAYFGQYADLLGRIVLVQPTRPNTQPWSIVTHSDTKVKTWGAGIGFDYKMANNFFSFLNAYTDNLTDVPSGFRAEFNTPKYRVNAGFGNSGLGKNKRIGFNVNLRWQDEFFWEGGGFADGTVKAYTTIDAQVNYKLPKIKSMVKLGGTNITNKFYQTGLGNPYIGGMYYVSFSYNIL